MWLFKRKTQVEKDAEHAQYIESLKCQDCGQQRSTKCHVGELSVYETIEECKVCLILDALRIAKTQGII
tara:strand:+ start:3914 stop:4120 length:207 start_codon:yes stop_codon:yes gene_type:complete